MLRVTVDTNVLPRTLTELRAAAEGLDVEIATTTVTLRENPPAEAPMVAETAVHADSTYDEGVYADAIPETGVWNESHWGEFIWGPSPAVAETWVLGESPLGMAALGSDESPSRFEAILETIGTGSFPKPGDRENLGDAERRQLRDAMILEAHARERRDILVSNDVKAFGKPGSEKRRHLEALCQTKIMTVDEFREYLDDFRARHA